VSAARGLALGLGIPAHGVSLLEALSYGTEGPVLASLDARREQVYLQRHGRGTVADIVPCLADPAALPPGLAAPGLTCIGHRAELIAEQLGAHAAHAALASAPAIARIAATRPAKPTERPAPLYIRTPDAALPREPAPVILL
jgi:tRNA A37 threonylcarbamoyladenosine modification protein TsaB